MGEGRGVLEVNKEGVEPEMKELAVGNVGEEFRFSAQVEQIHVHLLTEGYFNIPTEEKRSAQHSKGEW